MSNKSATYAGVTSIFQTMDYQALLYEKATTLFANITINDDGTLNYTLTETAKTLLQKLSSDQVVTDVFYYTAEINGRIFTSTEVTVSIQGITDLTKPSTPPTASTAPVPTPIDAGTDIKLTGISDALLA